MCGIKKPLGFKLSFELLKGELQGTNAIRFTTVDKELIGTARFINTDGTMRNEREAVLNFKAQMAQMAAEHDGTQKGGTVF